MPANPDPFQAHLNRAASLFQQGEAVQAGQIWQAILKRDPAHQAARAGLYQVKLWLETRNPPADNEQLLREGCTLYDMGQMQDALQKWERILAADPRHKLALAYANDARRELGLQPLERTGAGEPPVPQTAEAQAGEPAGRGPGLPAPGADQLVLEGVQIYDMGMVEEAMVKWERALKLVPEHKDALAYLEMARRDQEQSLAAANSAPVEAPKTVIDPGIWRAEQLLQQNRLEEAAQAFQRLLDRDSRDPRVLKGYHQARALLNARTAPQAITLAELDHRPPPSIPAPVGPPPALTARSAPQRNGFRLPGLLQGRKLPPWLNTPRNLTLAASLLLLGIVGAVIYGEHRREAALKEAVAAAKTSALRPVARMTQIPALAQSTDEVRQEATRALADDPLLAYFRAEEWQRREPDSSAALELVTRAKAAIAGLKHPAGTLADFEKDLQGGDLDGARQIVLGLLQQAPDDPELRARAQVVLLALAPIYATKERFDDARDALRLGRAMFPVDKNWAAKLKLLESIQAMAKPDRTPWIPLLG